MKVLYCHGFASGPRSAKGSAVREHLGRRGIAVDLLDLRVPTAEELRLSRMVDVIRAALDGHERALAIGSSLGGLAVGRAAERDARVAAAVLLAPAFHMAERMRVRMGEVEWARWRREGRYRFRDHASPSPDAVLHIDFGFIEDLLQTDVGWPDLCVPTTIVHGTMDESVDPALSRAFASARSNVRLVEVEDDHQLLGSLDVIRAEIDRALELTGA